MTLRNTARRLHEAAERQRQPAAGCSDAKTFKNQICNQLLRSFEIVNARLSTEKITVEAAVAAHAKVLNAIMDFYLAISDGEGRDVILDEDPVPPVKSKRRT